MCVLPICFVKEIIFHIEGNGAHSPCDIVSGKSLTWQDKHKAEKNYEKCLRIYGPVCFHGMLIYIFPAVLSSSTRNVLHTQCARQ